MLFEKISPFFQSEPEKYFSLLDKKFVPLLDESFYKPKEVMHLLRVLKTGECKMCGHVNDCPFDEWVTDIFESKNISHQVNLVKLLAKKENKSTPIKKVNL
jgi:hypothetical protein